MHRLSKLARHVIQSNIAENRYPYRLTYAVTSRCQARCIMCNIWRKPVEDELTLAEIDDVFARASRFSWINLTGGELFQREDLAGIFRSIDRHCRGLYLLNFPTNGFQTDLIVATVREILDRMRMPRLMVTVSLDGPQELHDRIRNLPGSWSRALDTFRQLRELRSRRFSVYLGYTIQADNLHAFDETLAAARSELGGLSVDDFHVNLAHVSGHYYANQGFSGVPEPLEAGRMLTRIGAARRRRLLDPVAFLERSYQRLAWTYQQDGSVPLVCQAAAASCFIDPQGNVFPCSGFAAPLGSLRENDYDLYRIWRGAERHRVRRAVRDRACPGCWTPCEAYQTILANLVSLRRGTL
ncbi:MAG: radical SAM protein [Desulfobacteraceae bacterium]|nr:radical SAM protein [Desulfobacteraceae bacterium]